MNEFVSKKNITRFTYENSAFLGWRVYLTRRGTPFVKYFSDKKFGGPKESLEAAEAALTNLKDILRKPKLVNGELSEATVKKATKVLN